jgi:hypothetical protein
LVTLAGFLCDDALAWARGEELAAYKEGGGFHGTRLTDLPVWIWARILYVMIHLSICDFGFRYQWLYARTYDKGSDMRPSRVACTATGECGGAFPARLSLSLFPFFYSLVSPLFVYFFFLGVQSPLIFSQHVCSRQELCLLLCFSFLL